MRSMWTAAQRRTGWKTTDSSPTGHWSGHVKKWICSLFIWSKCDLKSSSSSSSLLWLFPCAPRSQVSVQLPCVKVLIHPSYQSYWIALCSGIAFVFNIWTRVSAFNIFQPVNSQRSFILTWAAQILLCQTPSVRITSESNSWYCRRFIYICA